MFWRFRDESVRKPCEKVLTGLSLKGGERTLIGEGLRRRSGGPQMRLSGGEPDGYPVSRAGSSQWGVARPRLAGQSCLWKKRSGELGVGAA